ncbi:hypothetical protein ACQRBI_00135 [Lactobacillus johnsonii]|uniref:hypothetical protein n=1 Tax=Lactobacillus johnsonii TaxID=33959 RepID=UPI003D016C51
MSLTVNLYYTGKNGSARKFAEEMESSGVADLRKKYDLHMRVERYISDENGIPSSDQKFIRK